jgi:hypothetical protein
MAINSNELTKSAKVFHKNMDVCDKLKRRTFFSDFIFLIVEILTFVTRVLSVSFDEECNLLHAILLPKNFIEIIKKIYEIIVIHCYTKKFDNGASRKVLDEDLDNYGNKEIPDEDTIDEEIQ